MEKKNSKTLKHRQTDQPKKSSNSNLNKANKTKNDEFYTLYIIYKKLSRYKPCFKNKIVFCNCDDPEWSSFWTYFKLNFKHLGLRKLISTHYSKDGPSYELEMFF